MLEFKPSAPLTLGVELEMQIVDRLDWDLTRGASDLLALVARRPHPGDIKPEITESMIEVSTGIHRAHGTLVTELRAIRDVLVAAADRLNLGICGGGTHPFQHWSDRQIFDTPRFRYVSELYGYLAKQFTVFGQHIHVGCADGDEALRQLHALGRFIPHFIALSAASPYSQGADTSFDSSRLNAVFAFPLSGRAPFLLSWREFDAYFERMRGYGIVESMKDFYWDIRPKPEYGTIEIRVCDTPLTVERAAALAAYAQMLCRWLAAERPFPLTEDLYLVYNYNRFQACRFGLAGNVIDPATRSERPIRDDILATLEALAPHAAGLDARDAHRRVLAWASEGASDARWLRELYQESHSLPELVRRQVERFRGA
ncbi:MAG: YbdK family carboxylate-amine ligase [Burkholderiales bacterium]|nr:YbdK family carboxylate-amine ligase [Burkholderiales bacterium]